MTRLHDARPARGPWERATIRARHAIFSCGASDVARLRGWDRWARWRQHGPRRRLRELLKLVLLPARAVRKAYRGVRSLGAEVAEHHGVPAGRQFRDLVRLRLCHGIEPDSYYLFQLFRPERRQKATQYVQVGELDRCFRLLIARTSPADARVFADKRRFEAWCREHALPTAATFVELEGGRTSPARAEAVSLPPVDLFSKPANWRSGKGARCWTYDGNGGYVGCDGRVRGPAELVAELAATSLALKRPVVLQERLHNHPALAPLTSGGLCTVRMITYRPVRGDVRLLLCVLRMPAGGSPVDNFEQGGLAAPVDLATGRLGRAVRRSGGLVVDAERHPDTGAAVEGQRVPCWPEAVALVHRAHRLAGRMVVVGWDVAIVADGPAIVEGNRFPSSRLSQVASGVPLGETPLVRCLDAHMRESFGI